MAKFVKAWQQLSIREKRIIGIALLIALIFIFVNYIFDPIYATYQGKQNELKSQKVLLKKYEHLIANQDKAREKLRVIKAIKNGVDEVLLENKTSDLANAELQGIVKNLAQKANVKFTRITPNKAGEMEGFLEISLKLPFVGTIPQVQTFLYELETAPQLFYIKSMSVRTQRKDANKLRIEMIISAFIRAEAEVENDEVDSQAQSDRV